jgi:hypothetical protein
VRVRVRVRVRGKEQVGARVITVRRYVKVKVRC